MSIFIDNPIRQRDIVGTVRLRGEVYKRLEDGVPFIAMRVTTDAWPVRELTVTELRRLTQHFVRPVVEGSYEGALAQLVAQAETV